MQNPEDNNADENPNFMPAILKPKPRTNFLKRYILSSDNHSFVGRVYGLSIVAYHFDTYEELAKHDDCRYAYDINGYVTLLTRRVESLNLAGDMLWPEPFPTATSLPISLYDWLRASADVFLMRFISVVDCSLQLVNAIYEVGLPSIDCKLKKLKKAGVSTIVIELLGQMLDEQSHLRAERNARVHEGVERNFTLDDMTFRTAALHGIRGIDETGRRINVNRSFREGLVGLQREFNTSTNKLVRQLDELYDILWEEFENRFGPRIAQATHGFSSGAKSRPTSK